MRFDIDDDDLPSIRDCIRLSVKTFAGLVALLGLSFLTERAIGLIGMQLLNFPIVIIIFFVLLVGLVLIVNHHHHKEVHRAIMPNVRAWWIYHRRAPSIAIFADLLVVLIGIMPAIVITLLLFNWPPLPHLVCIGILLNLVIICPKRKSNSSL